MESKKDGHRQKLAERTEGLVTKAINKVFLPKLAKMSLPEQVKVAEKMIRWQGVPAFRMHFIQDKNFPQDIKEKKDAGMTPDQIWEYYWSCPEFVAFWKSLELDEEHLREIIYGHADEQPAEVQAVA
jgi:hypothetical protein